MPKPCTAPKARPPAAAPDPPDTGRDRWVDAGIVAVVAVALRLPAFLASAHLSFDDGVYGASAVAMRAGGAPFRDVFSSQGPLWLPLVWLGDAATFRTSSSPRTVAVVAGAVLAVAVYLAGREVTGRAGALIAAALVAFSGSALWTTGPLTSDGAGEALGAAAVATALVYRRRPGPGRAVVIGLLAGAAVAVKSLLVLPAVLVAALVVLAAGRRRDVAAAGLAAAALVVAATVPWGVAEVYQQSVAYHTGVSYERTPGANLDKALSTLTDRDPTVLVAGLVAAGAGAVLAVARRRRGRAGAPSASTPSPWRDRLVGGRAPLVAWALLATAVLALEAPMWRNHVIHLVVPLALLIGAARVPWPVVATAALLAVPWQLAGLGGVLRPPPYRGAAATTSAALRRMPPGAQAISDDPGLVWRSGRLTPPDFVDTSVLRITSTDPRVDLTEDDVVAAAAEPAVCAVVQWSGDRFGRFRALGARLSAAGYRSFGPDLGRGRRLWLKRPCRPPSARAAVAAPSGRERAAAARGR